MREGLGRSLELVGLGNVPGTERGMGTYDIYFLFKLGKYFGGEGDVD